jgi:iron complex outermembrane receptor protein
LRITIRRRIAAALTVPAFLVATGSVQAATAETHPLDLEELLKVRVVGASKYEQSQDEVPAAVAVITHEEIRRFGWRTLAEALRTLPGVYASYDRQYEQVGTRGLGLPGDYNTRLLLTINGNRVNDPLFDTGPTGRDFPLDLDLIDRIEFIPGPGSAVYGQNAMFGVVNIITRRGADLAGAEGSLSGQHPQRTREGRLSWGGVFDNGLDVLVSASGMRSRGENLQMSYGASGIAGIARRMDGEHDIETFAHAALGAWQFEWTHGSRHKDDPTAAYLANPLVPGQYQQDMYSLSQLRYETTLGNAWDLSARLFGGAQRYSTKIPYVSLQSSLDTSTWWGTEWRVMKVLREAHRLQLGIEYQDNHHIDMRSIGATAPAHDLDIDVPSHRLGVFAQDEWRIRPKLTATLGLRADRNADGSSSLNPRAALVWQAKPDSTIKVLYGTAHRQPNASESYFDDGVSLAANPMLHHERIQTTELVADQHLDSNFLLHASVYRWVLDDVIQLGRLAGSDLSQYRNGPRIHAEGAEVAADRSWPGGIRLRGSLSFSNLARDDNQPDVNAPRWLARGLLSAPVPVAGLLLTYELRYDDHRSTYIGTQTGGQLLSDLRLSTSTWIAGTDIALRVRNLFDRHYSYPAGDTNWQTSLEQDGRSIGLQVQARF